MFGAPLWPLLKPLYFPSLAQFQPFSKSLLGAPLSLRIALIRAWYGTSYSSNTDLWYSAPPSHSVQKIDANGTTTFVIPSTDPNEIKAADAVYIHIHGGGLMIRHMLQYLQEYKRWVELAARRGKKLVILAPIYPLSPQKKWPAQHSPRAKTDFLVGYANSAIPMDDMIQPDGLPFDTPEISALLWDDISKLPPQLIFWSTTEQLASDSDRWINRSRNAGVEVVEHKVTGQLHTYSLGWPFISQTLQNECDGLFLDFLFSHV